MSGGKAPRLPPSGAYAMPGAKPISRLLKNIIIVVFWAAILAITACGDRNVYAPPPPPQVTVVQPVRQEVTDYLEFTGNTQAINTVQLRARVQGFLEKVFFKDGDLVKKGRLLFLIQQNTYQDQLAQAKAQVLQQKANYDHAVIETAALYQVGATKGRRPNRPGQLAVPAGRLPGRNAERRGGGETGPAQSGLYPGYGPL